MQAAQVTVLMCCRWFCKANFDGRLYEFLTLPDLILGLITDYPKP
jgi:hypothetical protein